MQKWQFLLQMFPQNPALRRIAVKRSLEIVDLTPEELREVEDAEKQAEEMARQQMMMQQIQPQTQQTGSPSAPPMGRSEPIPALGR